MVCKKKVSTKDLQCLLHWTLVKYLGLVTTSNGVQMDPQKVDLATYHPEMDSHTKCVDQILNQYLQIYTGYQQDRWEYWIPLAESL